jgi:hypothetical protein
MAASFAGFGVAPSGRLLDVCFGVVVGVAAASVAITLSTRRAARNRPADAPPNQHAAAGLDESFRESAKASSLPQARPRSESLPVPMRDMQSLLNVVLRPPLDARVASMLEATSLCYLSTFSFNSDGEPSPHLSLMRFTYVRGEEVVLVSTNMRTKKFAQMCNSPAVAVLVHDFADPGRTAAGGSGGEGTVAAAPKPHHGSLSITLNGTVRSRAARGLGRAHLGGCAAAERQRGGTPCRLWIREGVVCACVPAETPRDAGRETQSAGGDTEACGSSEREQREGAAEREQRRGGRVLPLETRERSSRPSVGSGA